MLSIINAIPSIAASSLSFSWEGEPLRWGDLWQLSLSCTPLLPEIISWCSREREFLWLVIFGKHTFCAVSMVRYCVFLAPVSLQMCGYFSHSRVLCVLVLELVNGMQCVSLSCVLPCESVSLLSVGIMCTSEKPCFNNSKFEIWVNLIFYASLHLCYIRLFYLPNNCTFA